MKCNSLYSELVTPSSRWWSPISLPLAYPSDISIWLCRPSAVWSEALSPDPNVSLALEGDDDDDRPTAGHQSHGSLSGGIRMSDMGHHGPAGSRLSQFSSQQHGSLQHQKQQQQLNHIQAQRRGPLTVPRSQSYQTDFLRPWRRGY